MKKDDKFCRALGKHAITTDCDWTGKEKMLLKKVAEKKTGEY